MNNQPVKVKRYYGLRLMSLVYKALAIVTVLLLIGGVGYLTVSAATSPLGNTEDFNWWLTRALAIALGGGISAFTFFVLAQVLDVLVTISDNLRVLARKEEIQLASDTGLQSSNLQVAHELEELKTAIDQQNRLLRLQVSSQTGQPVQPIPPTQQTNP